MTNNFTVSTHEIVLIDEELFLTQGGQRLTFGDIDNDTVQLSTVGSRESISALARRIIAHRAVPGPARDSTPRLEVLDQRS
jgi:hypothetical protein